MNFEALWLKAKAAAAEAAAKANAVLGPEGERGFDCGFAWVMVRPATGPFVNWCKKNGYGKRGGYEGGGGYGFWYTSLHGIPTQSVSVHEAAAKAFAEVLKAAGIGAYWNSRLD